MRDLQTHYNEIATLEMQCCEQNEEIERLKAENKRLNSALDMAMESVSEISEVLSGEKM